MTTADEQKHDVCARERWTSGSDKGKCVRNDLDCYRLGYERLSEWVKQLEGERDSARLSYRAENKMRTEGTEANVRAGIALNKERVRADAAEARAKQLEGYIVAHKDFIQGLLGAAGIDGADAEEAIASVKTLHSRAKLLEGENAWPARKIEAFEKRLAEEKEQLRRERHQHREQGKIIDQALRPGLATSECRRLLLSLDDIGLPPESDKTNRQPDAIPQPSSAGECSHPAWSAQPEGRELHCVSCGTPYVPPQPSREEQVNSTKEEAHGPRPIHEAGSEGDGGGGAGSFQSAPEGEAAGVHRPHERHLHVPDGSGASGAGRDGEVAAAGVAPNSAQQGAAPAQVGALRAAEQRVLEAAKTWADAEQPGQRKMTVPEFFLVGALLDLDAARALAPPSAPPSPEGASTDSLRAALTEATHG